MQANAVCGCACVRACVRVCGVLHCSFLNTVVQLDAGEEHSIRGKTVRVNRAGPRPALHLSAANSDPGRQGISHVSSAPMSGGVSRQRGGHSTSEPSTSSTRLQNLGTLFPDPRTTLPDLLCAASIGTSCRLAQCVRVACSGYKQYCTQHLQLQRVMH